MRVLSSVIPTPEQLRIISRTSAGTEIIRGAAGSGKTTTAILRLRGLTGVYLNRRRRTQSNNVVRALILTFNRTLKGYVQQLASEQAALGEQITLTVDTFGHWAFEALGRPNIPEQSLRHAKIQELGAQLPLEPKFLCDEVEYLCGLYLPANRRDYLTARRDGRGTSPRVERPLRERILNEVVLPYEEWKRQNGFSDWSDLEVAMAGVHPSWLYDIVIVDETQDFSANQLRAILNHTNDDSALTFILDSAQRIYARGFSWTDAGVRIASASYHRLEHNYRNTAQIAAFAAPLIEGITLGDADATIPNLNGCTRTGPLPSILVGRFSAQMSHAIDVIRHTIDLASESVAFLHPAGGGWFNSTRQALNNAGLPFVEITRQSEWPTGPENIALSTIPSAKGLEFDHVFMLGFNGELLHHGTDPGDDEWTRLRRLLAMGVTRGKSTVCIGYKPEDRSDLMALLRAGTFNEIAV